MESEFKTCAKCHKNLSTSEFNKRQRAKDGLQTRCRICCKIDSASYYKDNHDIRREKLNKQRDFYRKLIREYIIEKLKIGCIDCLEKDLIVLDFDHVGNKEHAISSMIRDGFGLEKIALEIDKCVVRCANCHRRKTAKDFNWWRLNIEA